MKKYCGKKTKDITEIEKKYKAFFKGKEGIFIIEKLVNYQKPQNLEKNQDIITTT